MGTGGPGYKFEDEPVKGDYVRGALAMANSGPNTNGSQFFICTDDLTGRLPKNYTLFGQVTKGMDVVDKIVSAPRNARDLPDDPVAMTKCDGRGGMTSRGVSGTRARRDRLARTPGATKVKEFSPPNLTKPLELSPSAGTVRSLRKQPLPQLQGHG